MAKKKPRSRKGPTRGRPKARPRGIFEASPRGFGFVTTPEGEFFVPAKGVNGAMDGDEVELSVQFEKRNPSRLRHDGRPASDRPKASVARVLNRATGQLVGRLEVAEPFGVVVPLDASIPYDIFTPLPAPHGARHGDLVRVTLLEHPTRHRAATGRVTEVLGPADEERLPIEAIIARHRLETAFAPEVLAEARSLDVGIEEALAQGAEDLRHRLLVTIDPSDARDFDDALSLEVLAEQAQKTWDLEGVTLLALPKQVAGAPWRLGVSIADVASYVTEGSALDAAARRRATSVYLADRVLPMLPERLSNNLCSLRPGEDRRALTVDLYLGHDGALLGFKPRPSVIRSKARLTYDQAQGLLEDAKSHVGDMVKASLSALAGAATYESQSEAGQGHDAGSREVTQSELKRLIRGLSQVAQAREARRIRAGGLEFDAPEAKVRLDEKGVPLAIEVRERTAATSLVEEAMIAANEAVATYFQLHSLPTVYRIHEAPDTGRLQEVAAVLTEFPWFAAIDTALFTAGHPPALQEVLQACEGRPEEELVNQLLLRAMQRARYSPDNRAHYGLASAAYLHFTSPIRRYPDLVVHRLLRRALTETAGKSSRAKTQNQVRALADIAAHSSRMERVAEDAARESQEAKMVEFLAARVGETFSGVISGVIERGLYVRLDCTAEGFVPLSRLGREAFRFDARGYRLVGEESARAYRLGQRVAVRLDAADALARRLTFSLVGPR